MARVKLIDFGELSGLFFRYYEGILFGTWDGVYENIEV